MSETEKFERKVTVSVRIFHKIFLVILFCGIKIFERFHFDRKTGSFNPENRFFFPDSRFYIGSK